MLLPTGAWRLPYSHVYFHIFSRLHEHFERQLDASIELKDPFSMLVIVRSSNLKSGHEEKRAKGTMMYLLSTVVSILVTMIPSDTDVVTLHYDTLLHIQKKSKLTYWRIIL